MQDNQGQIQESYSVSAGLDFPSVGPQHAHLAAIGRAEYPSVTDKEALDAFQELAKSEGIIPALESSHALAHALKMARSEPEKSRCLSSTSPVVATKISSPLPTSLKRRNLVMNRYAQLFSRLDEANQGAFVPFVMLGDPTPNSPWPSSMRWWKGRRCPRARHSLLRSGSGRPHHSGRSPACLCQPHHPGRLLRTARRIRAKYPQLPIGLLVYANLVYVRHIDGFMRVPAGGRGFGAGRRRAGADVRPYKAVPTSSASTASLSPRPMAMPRPCSRWRSLAVVTPIW